MSESLDDWSHDLSIPESEQEARWFRETEKEAHKFGKRLKGLLNQKGWSLEQLAVALDQRPSAYGLELMLEHGDLPQKITIRRIAEVLGVSVSQLGGSE